VEVSEMGLAPMAKLIILMGLLMVFIGALLLLVEKVPFPFIGKLPGDIIIRRKNFTLYFPLATSILISIILSILLTLLLKR